MGNIDDVWVWDDLKERFVTNMESTTGSDEVFCNYIIRNINAQGWVASRDSKTDEDSLIYLVLLHCTG